MATVTNGIKTGIIGCGFGTALAVMFEHYGHTVTAWTKYPEEAAEINRNGEHKRLLPGVKLPESIRFTADAQLLNDADFVFVAVPSAFVRDAVTQVKPFIKPSAVIINVGKGFEEISGKRQSQVIHEVLTEHHVNVMSGPCHAEEVGRLMPTSVVIAGESAGLIQDTYMNERFRIYVSDDALGCELGAALKNPIALCCGIVEGMGYGDNTLAALMTRGLAEIMRLACAMGAKAHTLSGLSGVGDLIVTCTSRHSRNHRAGLLIGQGIPVEEAIGSVGTVEGYTCAKTIYDLACKLSVPAPIIEQLVQVCYHGREPKEALSTLMRRPKKCEHEVLWSD
jgi:glycerol-3-phosphate dehydrogenase (NAD(P)+)